MKNDTHKIRPIISVGDMAQALGHSRARFYQLQKQQIYPPPLYEIRTKRPFYDAHLQRLCLGIRESGIGWQGQYILFYGPRKESAQNKARTKTPAGRSGPPEYQELTETLKQMGLDVTEKQVSMAIEKLYRDRLANEDMGLVVREIYRYIRNSM
jgi:hypothetical protein